MKFKVGDKVKGNWKAHVYDITGSGVEVTVTKIVEKEHQWNNRDIEVSTQGINGSSYAVMSDYFDLIKIPSAKQLNKENIKYL